MIDELFLDLFGNLNLGDNHDMCIFIFGCLCVVGVFGFFKLFIKLLFKK